MGKGFKMNRPKDNFSKKQQVRAMEHVSVKPNEKRKKVVPFANAKRESN